MSDDGPESRQVLAGLFAAVCIMHCIRASALANEEQMSQAETTPGPDGPFADLLGIRPGVSEDGVGTAFMTIADKHRQRAGVVQGGLLVALADYAFFRACRSVLKEGEHAVTIELKLNFIAPAKDGTLTARSSIKSRGGRIIVGDMEIFGAEGQLIATGIGTYMTVYDRRGAKSTDSTQ